MRALFYSWLLIVAFDVADRNLIMHFDTEPDCLRAQYEAWEAGAAIVLPCREMKADGGWGVNGFPGAVHANDPASSYQAEARVTKSGKRRTDMEAVFAVLQKFRGRTAAELHASNLLGMRMDCISVRRRLWDLERRGMARKGEQRKCKIAGTLAVTWYPRLHEIVARYSVDAAAYRIASGK